MNNERKQDPLYSSFAFRLRQLRQKAKLRQEDMARLLNIHRTAYTKYETDCAAPDWEGLLKLADIFDVTVDYLLGRDLPKDRAAYFLRDDDDVVIELNEQEKLLLVAFRRLSSDQREHVVNHCCRQARKNKEQK